jgi:hypothetical protein
MAYQADPKVLKYAQDRYIESFNFLQEWKRRKVRQLVLLNNLQRGEQNIASTLLLTLFLRILSSNYDDKNQVKFLPSQGIMQEQLNAYNMLAESDYLEMGKAKLDYDSTWDTVFFNRSYIETLRFDKKRKIMQPCVINPLSFGYDPYFTEVQEWRYYWKWITKSRVDVERLIKKGVITGITSPDEIMGGMDDELWNYKALRDQAKDAVEPPPESMGGDIFQILEFYTYDEDGDKCVYWFDKTVSTVLWHEKLKLNDLTYNDEGVESVGSKWPIVTKELFRDPHASLSFSVADILEDKHRAKSVLLNLAYIAAKDQANPTYLYNPDKVQDVSQFLSRQINQHIPVNEMDGAVLPLNTQDPMSAGLLNFISMLQQEANDPVGTAVEVTPDSGTGETATKSAIDQQMNDMAQSIQSKVMQFGESEFWSHWFHRYAKYGPELESKIANIVGVKGITSHTIDFKDFNTDFPPGVLVYSAKEAEYKELVLRRDLMQLYPQLMQSLDPDGMRNFNKHVFFPKFLNDPSLIDIMLPKTLDEIKADEENETLKKDEYVPVAPTDNHTTHIYIHHMVQPKTWALWIHLFEHEKYLAEQKAQEQLAAQQQMMEQPAQPGQQQPSQVNIGAEKKSTVEAASPMKQEINSKDSTK